MAAASVIGLLAITSVAFAAGGGAGGGNGAGPGGASVSQATPPGNGTQDRDRNRIQDPTTHTGDEPLQTRDQDRTQLNTSSPGSTTGGAANGSGAQNQQGQSAAGAPGNGYGQTGSGAGADSNGTSAGQNGVGIGGAVGQGYGLQYRLQIDPQHLQVHAQNGAGLGQMVQTQARVLNQQAASTTAVLRPALQNANQVRLAAYAFMAAQNMYGTTTGQQMAAVASQIDQSAQVTANAEAQVATRGFWARLFFGGDTKAAAAISDTVAQNRDRIQTLQQLIDQASTTDTVRAQLQDQLKTLQQEQDRLSQLADQQKSKWGIFSWRF